MLPNLGKLSLRTCQPVGMTLDYVQRVPVPPCIPRTPGDVFRCSLCLELFDHPSGGLTASEQQSYDALGDDEDRIGYLAQLRAADKTRFEIEMLLPGSGNQFHRLCLARHIRANGFFEATDPLTRDPIDPTIVTALTGGTQQLADGTAASDDEDDDGDGTNPHQNDQAAWYTWEIDNYLDDHGATDGEAVIEELGTFANVIENWFTSPIRTAAAYTAADRLQTVISNIEDFANVGLLNSTRYRRVCRLLNDLIAALTDRFTAFDAQFTAILDDERVNGPNSVNTEMRWRTRFAPIALPDAGFTGITTQNELISRIAAVRARIARNVEYGDADDLFHYLDYLIQAALGQARVMESQERGIIEGLVALSQGIYTNADLPGEPVRHPLDDPRTRFAAAAATTTLSILANYPYLTFGDDPDGITQAYMQPMYERLTRLVTRFTNADDQAGFEVMSGTENVRRVFYRTSAAWDDDPRAEGDTYIPNAFGAGEVAVTLNDFNRDDEQSDDDMMGMGEEAPPPPPPAVRRARSGVDEDEEERPARRMRFQRSYRPALKVTVRARRA